jgi:tripartite motif-containing protein 71
MNSAFNATWNEKDNDMKSGLRKFKKVMIACILANTLFFIHMSSGAAVVKFRYITSLYSHYSSDKEVPLQKPEGVACNNQGTLIVADSGNGRLLRYNLQGEVLGTDSVEIRADRLLYPVKTEINSKGEIYTLDRSQRSIVRMTPAGEFISYLQPTGLPSPASYVPRSFTTDKNDNVYILDILSERVLILTSEGKYLRHIKFPQEYGFFSDIAVDFKGTVLLIDGVQAVVFSAANDATGFIPLTDSLKQYVRFPNSLTTDSRGRIYLVDRNGGSIIILGQDGSFLGRQSGFGWKEGRLNYPSQVCINGEGEVFIADTRNNRVQIFEAVE